MKKKCLFLTILFIAMVFIGMPKVEAAFIDTKEKFASYINATIDGSTITLTGNKTIGDADDFMIFDDCTIDLNGHTLTYEMNLGNPFRIHSNVTIKNGTINGVVHYWKTLTIENAILTDITGRAESFTIVKGNSSINNEILGNITIENGATLIIDSNDFRFGYHSYNNNGHLLTNNGTIIIKDSNSVFIIDSDNNILNNGIILNYGGTFTNNGTLSSASTGRIVNNPRKIEKLAMTNGTIDAFYYVGENDTATLKMMPNTGYRFKNGTLKVMKGDMAEIPLTEVNDTTYTFTMPRADVTVFAEFEKIPYTITINNTIGGTITADKLSATINDIVTLTVAPDTYYKLKNITGITMTKVNDTTYTFTMPSENVTIDAEYELIFEEKTITKTVGDLTVGIKGAFSQEPELVITKIEKGNSGYDSLITLVKEDKTVIGSYDISLAGGTYKGELELTFTIGKQYEGDKITIYHKKASGDVETLTAKVEDGKSTIKVTELSPFMLVADKEVVAKKDETPKTGNNNFIGVVINIALICALSGMIAKKKMCKKL